MKRNLFCLGARGLLGGLLLMAGGSKAMHPADFASQVAAYQIVPGWGVSLVALALPWIEIVAGLALLTGFVTPAAALVAGGLCGLFTAVTTSALGRGLSIDCGCFPGARGLTWLHPLENLALLALALTLARYGPGPLSLDPWLQRPRDESF